MLEPAFLLAQCISGLTAAMFLFIVASGLSLIFGVLRVLNFAHGSFYMIGAYMAWQITHWAGANSVSFWIAVPGAALAVALLGGIVERLFLRHLYGREELYQLLFTYALVLILGDLARIVWGTQQLTVARPAGPRRRARGAGHRRAALQSVHHRAWSGHRACLLAAAQPHGHGTNGARRRARPRDAGRARRRRRQALHAHVHGRLVPRRTGRSLGYAGAQHRARHGRRHHCRGLHRRGDRRARIILGHLPRRHHLRSGVGLRHPHLSRAFPFSRCSC